MFSTNQEKFDVETVESNPVVVGAVSAAAGIAIGTAAAMYFSDEANRKKLIDSLEDFRVRAQGAIKTLVNHSEETAEKVKTETKNKVKNVSSQKPIAL